MGMDPMNTMPEDNKQLVYVQDVHRENQERQASNRNPVDANDPDTYAKMDSFASQAS